MGKEILSFLLELIERGIISSITVTKTTVTVRIKK